MEGQNLSNIIIIIHSFIVIQTFEGRDTMKPVSKIPALLRHNNISNKSYIPSFEGVTRRRKILKSKFSLSTFFEDQFDSAKNVKALQVNRTASTFNTNSIIQ